jgi:hypothetical protein
MYGQQKSLETAVKSVREEESSIDRVAMRNGTPYSKLQDKLKQDKVLLLK